MVTIDYIMYMAASVEFLIGRSFFYSTICHQQVFSVHIKTSETLRMQREQSKLTLHGTSSLKREKENKANTSVQRKRTDPIITKTT